MHLSGLNLFHAGYAANAIGVEWSIPVEVAYYLMLPAMIACAATRRGKVCLIVVAVAAYLAAPHFPVIEREGDAVGVGNLIQFPRYAPIYVAAVVAGFVASRRPQRLRSIAGSGTLVVAIALLALTIVSSTFRSGLQLLPDGIGLWYGLLTLLFVVANFNRSALTRLLFENAVAIWLGNVSFSLYLVHFPIHNYITSADLGLRDSTVWLMVLAASMAVASVSFLAIERPFIHHGRRRVSMQHQ